MRGEALVEAARATIEGPHRPRGELGQLRLASLQIGLARSEERRKGRVRVDDARAVTTHDEVALPLDQAAIALLAVGEAPEAVVERLGLLQQRGDPAAGTLQPPLHEQTRPAEQGKAGEANGKPHPERKHHAPALASPP